MPHYADGTEARLGDIVKGHGYNVKHEIIGKVVNIRPGEGCTLTVAYVGKDSPILIPVGGDLARPFQECQAQALTEFGDTKGFTKIA
jgi:hypothetical protein